LIDGLDMVNSTTNTTFDYAVSGLQPQPSNLNKTANLLDKLPLIPECVPQRLTIDCHHYEIVAEVTLGMSDSSKKWTRS
jgi:hypothetical protein